MQVLGAGAGTGEQVQEQVQQKVTKFVRDYGGSKANAGCDV
jgi:hypothetical protein